MTDNNDRGMHEVQEKWGDRVMVTFEEIPNGRQKATKSKSISLLNTSTFMNIILCLEIAQTSKHL